MKIISEYPVLSANYDEMIFCDKIRYQSPQYTQLCYECDRRAYAHVCETRKTYIYTCHSGCYEALVPIILDDEILCCLMIGQVHPQEGYCPAEQILSSLSDSIPITKELIASHAEMPCMTLDKFTSYVYFLEMCARDIYEKRAIRLKSKNLIEDFQLYVEENYRQPLSLKEVAEVLHISPYYLAHLIADELQTTFTEYLKHIRIDAAKKMLLHTDRSVADIAQTLTYKDATYFMRIFKKSTGMTCTEFRKKR